MLTPRVRRAVAIAVTLAGLGAGLLHAPAATAATPAPGYAIGTLTTGLHDPTAMVVRPDGSLLVAEQGGAIRVVRNGQLLPGAFATLGVDATGERGLLGIALHPNYPADPRVYVYRTVPGSPAHNQVEVLSGAGDSATGGPTPIVVLPNLSATNHNGGALHFGPDGQLYVAVGENAVPSNSQSIANPLGKLLRVTDAGAPAAGNPFADGGGPNDDRIFALGLRNPFTFGFQPGTRSLAINDVGSGSFEEVNLSFAGANHGWPQTEGPTDQPGVTGPAYAYPTHVDGTCAITGGAFYPSAAARVRGIGGRWLFADLCGGFLRAVDLATGQVANLVGGIQGPVDIDVLPNGQVLWLARDGSIGIVDGSVGAAPPSQTALARHRATSGVADVTLTYGVATDVLLWCDWDGDGDDTVAAFRDGAWLVRNSAGSGVGEATIGFGNPGDQPVCGDWDGDGEDDLGVFRPGAFFLRTSPGSGVADLVAPYGNPGDQPVVGDWDRDGDDTLGVRRANVLILRNGAGGGAGELTVAYGDLGDRLLVGDWDGDGDDTPAVVRGFEWFVRNAAGSGVATDRFSYGLATDRIARGDLDGTPGDGPIVLR